MRRFRPVLAALLLAAGSSAAADWQLRQGDAPFSQAELEALDGQVLRFFDGAEAAYGPDGAYAYTYSEANGGGTAQGRYSLGQDGEVCTRFPNGLSRCDLFVRNGGRVVVITEKGDRFPVRGE